MRILLVTQSYYPFQDRGGPAAKVRAMARGLAQRSELVTVLTVDLGLDAMAQGTQALQRCRQGWSGERDGVEVIYLPSKTLYRALTWNSGVSDFCRERLASFDVVHIYGFYDLLGPAVARWCRKLGIPYVVEPMGMYRPIVRNLAAKRMYRYLLGDAMTNGAARMVATAEQEQQELVAEGIREDKVVVRRNGMEPPENFPAAGTFRKQWRIPEGAQVLLFLGRVVPKKSPELLLEAFAEWQSGKPAAARRRPAVLVFAGPPEDAAYQAQLNSLSKQLNVAEKVLFTGPLYDDAKWAAYVDADLFVLPSQNENFGNTAAEAVVAGTPALVTDTCGIAPLIGGRAGEVIPHDGPALVAALRRLLDTDELRGQLRHGCTDIAPTLQWDQPLDETQAMYAELSRIRRVTV